MAGNASFNQFGIDQMNFQDRVQTSQYGGPMLHAIANLNGCINTRPQNMMNNATNASSQRPPPAYYMNHFANQPSNQMIPQDHKYLASLITDGRREIVHKPQQFVLRMKLQQYLLNMCKVPNLIQYLRNDLLTDFGSPTFYEVIERITKVDTEKLKDIIREQIGAQYYQNKLQGNQYSHENVPSQNFSVQGNFNQFQVQGSNNSRNSDTGRQFNQVPMNNVAYPQVSPNQQLQQQHQRQFLRGNVPNFPQNTQITQNTPPPQQTNQSSSGTRWYAMPTETYEAGKVVQDKTNPMSSLQGTVPLSHFNEPMPRASSAHSQISPGTHYNKSNQGAQRTSPAPSQISPRTVAQGYNAIVNNDRQNFPQVQPRPKSAEAVSSANMKRNQSTPVQCSQQDKSVKCTPHNCPSDSEKHVSPAESKQHLRAVMKMIESTSKNMPSLEEQNPIKLPVQQPVSVDRISGTPTLPGEQTCENSTSTPSEDITDLFSMPVLSETFTDQKVGEKDLPAKKGGAKYFDDMNVLSPFTADVVSDSVDTWLSGSKHSAILDTVGSKTSKGRQLTKPERPSPPSNDCVERTVLEEKRIAHDKKSNSSICNKGLAQQTTPDLTEYDPPLPVIKHRKREDRISPNKRSPEAEESKLQNSKDSKSVPENRKPLFSVMSDLMTENHHCSSKENSASEPKSSEDHDLNTEECKLSREKSRHKSSEVSSSSSPRHDQSSTSKNSESQHDHKKPNLDSEKSVEHSKAVNEQSCKDKIVSDWKRNHIEKESKLSKAHHRRKSCTDQEVPRQRLNRERRSLTWDGAAFAGKFQTRITEIENTTDRPIPFNGKLVDFNGHIILQIRIPDGTYLLMIELLVTCFQDNDKNSVLKEKTSALGVNNITLTHVCRKDVIKYLDYMKINYPSQLSIISLSNAQKLFDHLEEMKQAEEPSTEAKDSCRDQDEASEVSSDSKNRSASPDSTENASKKHPPNEPMETSMEEGDQDDLQQNKVSSQSLDDMEDPNVSELSHISALEDNDDTASNVSDATDIYCEGKPLPSPSGGGSGEGSTQFRVPLGLEGGLAVVEKENSPNTYLRFVILRGIKCYLYKDLFKLFGQAEVVKVVVNNYMQVKTCTPEEAEFFNRNQPSMSVVDPVNDSLLQDKYVRKLFLYFGEPFPTRKGAIDVVLTNENSSSKRSRDNEDCEPPSKKSRRSSGSVDNCSDKNRDSSAKMDDKSMEMFQKLKGQHMEMAAEVARLTAQLKQTQESSIAFEKKYKLYSDNYFGVKANFEELEKKNTVLEEGCKAQEENIAQLKKEMNEKDETIETLTRERDHFKYFVEKITDTYRDADADEEA